MSSTAWDESRTPEEEGNTRAGHPDYASSLTTERNAKLITFDANATEPDLGKLIEAIDGHLDYYKQTQGEEKSVRRRKFFRKISKARRIIEVAANVADAAIGVPVLTVVCFLLESFLKRIENIEENKKNCFKILDSVSDLAKIVMELQPFPDNTEKVDRKVEGSCKIINKGVIKCYKLLKNNSFLNSERNTEDLEEFGKQVEEMRNTLHVQLSVSTSRWLKRLFLMEYARTHVVDQAKLNNMESTSLYLDYQSTPNTGEITGSDGVRREFSQNGKKNPKRKLDYAEAEKKNEEHTKKRRRRFPNIPKRKKNN